jgi:tetratricopeptide (TPR) repeat protein
LQNVDAYYNRGITWQAMGENDRAMADLSEAIRLNPHHVAAFYNRSLIWQANGENDRASADRSEATRLDPRLSDPKYRDLASKAKPENDYAIGDFNVSGWASHLDGRPIS